MSKRSDPKPEAGTRAQHSDIQGLSPAHSGRRTREPLDAPTVTQLLELSLRISANEPLADVAAHTVETLSALIPGVALGVCLSDEGSEGQIVKRHVPEDWDATSGRDPTRLFPELPEERVVAIDRVGNSTLHLAGPQLPPDASPAWTVVEYARRAVENVLTSLNDAGRTRRDATELRKLQAQVIQAEKLASLGQIAAGIVHELNNPLTSIIAYAEYLRRNAATRADADALERLARIQEGAERILRFSRDLVTYARPAGDVPGPVHLGEVLEKAMVFCEHEFSERGGGGRFREHATLATGARRGGSVDAGLRQPLHQCGTRDA